MRKSVLAAAVAGLIGFAASSASAAPINLPGGPVYFQFNNLEQVSNNTGFGAGYTGLGNPTATGLGEGNWGVLNISSMQLGAVATPNEDIGGGPAFFFDDGLGGSQGQISGIFYGISLTSATTSTGGFVDLYWNDPGQDDITATDLAGQTFGPGARTAQDKAGKFTDGTFLVRLAFASGVIDGDALTYTSSSANPLNFSGTGQADSFANVADINGDGVINGADGAWAEKLNGDWFFVDPNGDGVRGGAGETRDLRFSTFFQNLNSWDGPGGAEGLRSNDPGRVYTVPEPGSLALVGLALAGLGIGSFRRRNG